MDPSYDNPFDSLDKLIPERGKSISNGLDAIVVDFHAKQLARNNIVPLYFRTE